MTTWLLKQNVYRKLLCKAFIAIVVISTCKFVYAQPPTPPPAHIWLSLQHSTLIQQSVDWNWLQKKYSDGSLLEDIKPINGNISGIVIPIFSNGQCFYQTSVAPFSGRNPNALQDERALAKLLNDAQKQHIPIYFSFDVLEWQQTKSKNNLPGIFKKYPELQAQGIDPKVSPETEELYASPFNKDVHEVLVSLMREITTKFQGVSGVLLNVKLSSGNILGYSEGARSASIIDISLDPNDLNISNAANAIIDTPVRRWIEWRRGKIRSLIEQLSKACKTAWPTSKVFADGDADYYTQQSFNDYRSSQDWKDWLNSGVIDNVFLEGRWLSRYHDVEYFHQYRNNKNSPTLKNLLPVSDGNHLLQNADYQREWGVLKSQNAELQSIVLAISNNDDLKRAVALVMGKIIPRSIPSPKLAETMPPIQLKTAAGTLIKSDDWWGKFPVKLFFLGNPSQNGSTAKEISKYLTKTPKSMFRSFIVSMHATSLENATDLVDPGGEVSALFNFKPTLVLADKAGFIRKVYELGDDRPLSDFVTQDFISNVTLGKVAPDFMIKDMNGNEVHLESYRNKKNILLTFFPKCFTGGCENHLASIRDSIKTFSDLDTVVLAVSIDPPDVQRAFAEQWRLPFQLIPDTGRNLSILYGAATNTHQLANRQSILIDKKGIVRMIDRNVHVSTHGTDILNQMRKIDLIQ